MRATLELQISTPAAEHRVDGVVRLRFDADDGARGVLPGHERARVIVVSGPVDVVTIDEADVQEQRFWVTEGGVAIIAPRVIRILTPWSASAPDLESLRVLIEERNARRRAIEREARAQAHRYEVATRRALAALRREVQG